MRYGLFASSFSPFPHMGHVCIIQQAIDKGACDSVVALLHRNPSIERPRKLIPPLTTFERMILLRGLKNVAQIVCYDTEQELEQIYRIACDWFDCCLIVGNEYRDSEYAGKHLNVPVFFPQSPPWHGTEIAHRIAFTYLNHQQKQ